MRDLADRVFAYLLSLLLSLFVVGCSGFTVQLVTLPDPGTLKWMQDTNSFNGEVKKDIEDINKRLQRLEQKEDDDGPAATTDTTVTVIAG